MIDTLIVNGDSSDNRITSLLDLSFDRVCNLYVSFDLAVAEWCNDTFGYEREICKCRFHFEIQGKEDLEILSKDFSRLFVEQNFINNVVKVNPMAAVRLKSKIKWLKDKAESWISSEEIDTPYNEDVDNFIEVDDETSFYGNYEMNGKEYCKVIIMKNDPKEISFDRFKEEVRKSVLPGYINKFLEENEINFYDRKEEDLRAIFDMLKYIDLYKICRMNRYGDDFCYDAPYRVFLGGNDDDSWSKPFNTKEEALEEYARLVRCQPINKEVDVKNNGYFFTN